VVFTLAAFSLADLPPFATFLGKGWIEESGSAHAMGWIIAVFVIASVLVGGGCCE
jgi:NADH:ubiquinone oxidoreductase subunit 2 (subunit N)